MKKTKDLVKVLIRAFPISKNKDFEFWTHISKSNNIPNFYEFATFKLNQFYDLIKELDNEDIKTILKKFGDFKGNISKRRFCNLIKRIKEQSIKILQYCYKGDIFQASTILVEFLNNDKKIKEYLVDPYFNYFDFKLLTTDKLYRMRDENEDKNVDNCSHVPFCMRKAVFCGRFSLTGYPCLYLADSKETANAEVGELKEKKKRWVSEFTPKQILPLIDLRIQNSLDISTTDERQLIHFLLTYPIRLLCLVQTEEEKEPLFREEYYFAQLLFHLLFMVHPKEKYIGYKGIVFSSTKRRGGTNYVIPALYPNMKPLSKGHSPLIQKIFHESTPEIYEY